MGMFMGPCDGVFHHPLVTAQSLHERRWHRNEHVEKVSPHQITSTTTIRELYCESQNREIIRIDSAGSAL